MLRWHKDCVTCLVQNPDNANHDGEVDVHKSALACILWSKWGLAYVSALVQCSKKKKKKVWLQFLSIYVWKLSCHLHLYSSVFMGMMFCRHSYCSKSCYTSSRITEHHYLWLFISLFYVPKLSSVVRWTSLCAGHGLLACFAY